MNILKETFKNLDLRDAVVATALILFLGTVMLWAAIMPSLLQLS